MIHQASRKSTPTRNHRQEADEKIDEEDDMKCTGKTCKSCAAHCIADCVAICCCPCAVINILAFAFLKVPWTVGKRILKHEKKKKKKKKIKHEKINDHPVNFPRTEFDGICSSEEMETPGLEFSGGGGGDGCLDESLKNNFISRYEEEELFFELYENFYLGFGRVSLSDNSSNAKSN